MAGAENITSKPASKTYENTVSGATISGTVYNGLNKDMKAKYTVQKSGKKAATPVEAK